MKPSTVNDSTDISWITKQTDCWIYYPQQQRTPIYAKAVVKGIIPLSFTKGNSKVMCALENGTVIETKASCLEKRRHSNSLEKDLIALQIINPAQILDQLERRLQMQKIHTYLWNSLIIVNPFYRIPGTYLEETMHFYVQKIISQKKSLSEIEPHIYGFVCNAINNLKSSYKIQFLSISGQSGSGKTETNKQCLKIISYVCQAHLKSSEIENTLIQERILNCDFIIQCFGNAKTEKNDNSSRFGKLITEKINVATMEITRCEIKGFFLEKSRIVHQFESERNFHIFYQLLDYSDGAMKKHLGFTSQKGILQKTDFAYLNRNSSILKEDQEMWENLQGAFDLLDFSPEIVLYIYQIVAAILHIGNLTFDDHTHNDTDPCEILNDELVPLIATLLLISPKQFLQVLVFHKKVLAGEQMHLPMTQKQCIEGRDSIAKSLYQNLFLWIIDQLNQKVNQESKAEQNVKILKMLDIYGFQVFEWNSFEQLNVNYTNQRIHQVYLDQVFKHEKAILKKQGLQSIIPTLKFTDNTKIIQLLDVQPKSIYNLLDESCSLNVRDEDFLNNVKKIFDGHANFPSKNNITTKKCFIVMHTPGEIEYYVDGFRSKNKDFLRQDIAQKMSKSKIQILKQRFSFHLQKIKSQSSKKFLGFKIRREVNALINQMSTDTDIHFIRCIKPNQEKKAMTFIERVCYNQIRYLGILDTVAMRKDCYHVRMNYSQFYKKYGILNGKVKEMIQLEKVKYSNVQCKDRTKEFLQNSFKSRSLQYLFGNERIFMKMETHNFFQTLLKTQMFHTNRSTTLIKAIWRYKKYRNQKLNYSVNIKKVQKTIRSYLRQIKTINRKNAVKVIERQWIRRSEQYFRRKKRNPLMVLQKYIKKAVAKKNHNENAQNIQKAKILLSSIVKSHKQANAFQNLINFKHFFMNEIIDDIWRKIKRSKNKTIQKYLNTFIVMRKNKKIIQTAHQRSKLRLINKSRMIIQKYMHAISYSDKFREFRRAIVKIQRNYRMKSCRRRFLNMKSTVIILQRAWRQYKYNKQRSILFTKHYFSDAKKFQEEERQILYRDLNPNSFNMITTGFQSALDNFQKIAKEKVLLFYYLVDFQILSYDLSLENWAKKYLEVAEQGLLKMNPIQFVDVTNCQTTCSTISKMYSWGCVDLKAQKFNTEHSYPIQQHYFSEGKIHKFSAKDEYISIQLVNPPKKITIGQEQKNQTEKQWSTLFASFVLLNGMILTVQGVSFTKINLPEKVAQISCGMGHVIIKTILKKIYTWGKNQNGQLGTGDYFQTNSYTPRLVDYFIKKKIHVVQVSASAYASIVLDFNCKLYWFGSNGTISNCCYPQQCLLSSKSAYLGNYNKYCPVRIVTRWSKTISITGVTIACYDGIFKNQISLRKKMIQNLISKWSDDISTINPPYVQSIADHLAQKHMPLPMHSSQQLSGMNKSGISNKEIRQKIIAQINEMQQTERQLLRQRKKQNSSSHNTGKFGYK